MPHFGVSVVFALAMLALVTFSPGQGEPPSELFSPDHQYSVTILHTALPGSDPNNGISTIAVRRGTQDLSKYPTEGFLLDAFWSPNEKYVAVNNRRGSGGDYLWVFRLSDGRAIKMPVNAEPGYTDDMYHKYLEQVVQRVTAVYPDLTIDQFRKLFVFAQRWTASGQLQVKTNLVFPNLDLRNEMAVVSETYKIENEKLMLLARKIQKARYPPERGPWPPSAIDAEKAAIQPEEPGGEGLTALAFTENFVRSLATNDVETQLRYYADRVDYYEFGQVTKEVIRKDLERDITTWPNRIHSMPDPPKITPKGGDSIAEFRMAYTLTNLKGANSGILQMAVRLKLQAQTWQVVGIQKKVIQATMKR